MIEKLVSNLGLVIFFDKDAILFVNYETLPAADAATAASTGCPHGLASQRRA